MLTRRQILAGSAAFGSLTMLAPGCAFAQSDQAQKRFFLVILRGAVDGLAFVPPQGDPDLPRIRGRWLDGGDDLIPLDATFALHGALQNLGNLYNSGDALVAHAIATAYRERSHFDAQNVLETGGNRPFALRDGWLNRFVGLLQKNASAMALAPSIPLILRGANAVSNYAPTALPEASAETLQRIDSLYSEDPALRSAWNASQGVQAQIGEATSKGKGDAAKTGELAARLMQGNSGARIAMLDVPGWDSHANQVSKLNRRFAELDALLASFKSGMGSLWPDTAVLVLTEFGRTVAINGTNGTDHGTGTAALLLGGNVRGKRVIADWPGLGSGRLHEGRDLAPTTSTEDLIAGTLSGHFGLDPGRVTTTLFPERKVPALGDLFR